MKKLIMLFCFIVLTVVSCTSEKTKPIPSGCDTAMSYNTTIKSIIDANCISCHVSGGTGSGDFTTYSGLKASVDNGSLKNRVLILKDMPEHPATMSDQDRLKISCWIQQGAPE